MEWDLNTVKAFTIAAHAAIGQKCKTTGEPYWKHPERVVEILCRQGLSAEHFKTLLAGAWLHDVVEDTQLSLELIKELFGREVARIVEGLTDVYTHASHPALNRAARKQLERERLADEEWDVQTIKCADITDNAQRLPSYPDKEFAQAYVQELAEKLELLTRADPDVRALAKRAVNAAAIALAG